MSLEGRQITRRSFLLRSGQSIATLALANVAVYAVGSAFKELDGSLIAGAKCSPAHVEGDRCWVGCGGGKVECAEWQCTGTTWMCVGGLGNCGGACY